MEKRKPFQESPQAERQSETPASGRRRFLKKAAYSAPTLIAMGYLAKPENAKAGYSEPPPPPPF